MITADGLTTSSRCQYPGCKESKAKGGGDRKYCKEHSAFMQKEHRRLAYERLKMKREESRPKFLCEWCGKVEIQRPQHYCEDCRKVANTEGRLNTTREVTAKAKEDRSRKQTTEAQRQRLDKVQTAVDIASANADLERQRKAEKETAILARLLRGAVVPMYSTDMLAGAQEITHISQIGSGVTGSPLNHYRYL